MVAASDPTLCNTHVDAFVAAAKCAVAAPAMAGPFGPSWAAVGDRILCFKKRVLPSIVKNEYAELTYVFKRRRLVLDMPFA